MRKIITCPSILISALILACPAAGHAAEGAASNYFPGAYGSLLVAAPPEPGYIAGSLNLFYSAKADRAVREGQVKTEIEADALYSYFQLLKTWDMPSTGGRFLAGISVPYAYSSMGASVAGPGGTLRTSASDTALGDMIIIPASYYWSSGNVYFNIYEAITAPTGQYSDGADVNIGRNYWSFDTVLAMTWFNPESGTEFSVVPGIMVNTKNKATDYRTGTEFHVDFIFNQFVSESVALGIHGYGYYQISGDSGSGALLGDFKSRSWGLGPAISYIPPKMNGRFVVNAKYMTDVSATNRLKADYGMINLTWTF